MRIKKIKFTYKITNPYTSNLDVFVENKNTYTYAIVVNIPGEFLNLMDQKKVNKKPLIFMMSKLIESLFLKKIIVNLLVSMI